MTETIDTNQIANHVLLKWSDNVDISDDSPAEYLEKYQPKLTKEMLKEWEKSEKRKEQLNNLRSIIGKI